MAKIKSKYAIGTYEINLMTEEERQYMFNNLGKVCDYIDTAINYNNDYLLDVGKHKIITKIAPCHYCEYDLFVNNHLKCLNRKYIDIMLIHNNRGDWLPLAKRMAKDKRFKQIGVSNFTIEELELYKKELGFYPKYNEIEINPYYTDIDTINYCKQHKIKIIAYCILGGKYNAMRFISMFSLPYLISYAANYSDIVILRADSFRQTNEFVEVVNHFNNTFTKFEVIANNKSMQPMIYNIPQIQKYYCNELSYFTGSGYNTNKKYKLIETLDTSNFPEFEMLGDYLAYVRYKFSKEKIVKYDKDFLKIDNNKYIVMRLFSKGCLTKVNIDAKKEVKVYELY